MPKSAPDHHDAELLLKVYDIRREAVMRESRTAVNRQFWPSSYDDVRAVAAPEHPLNAAYRQTSTYWEMVFGMARHGIVNGDYWAEFNGEGLLLFAKVAPFVDEIRRDVSPTAFANAQWLARECETGRRLFGMMQKRVAAAAVSDSRVPTRAWLRR